MALQQTLGFLGFGNMGAAIAQGLLERGVAPGSGLIAYDVDAERRRAAEALGIRTAASAAELLNASDAVLLAVKPQRMDSALEHLEPQAEDGKLFISVAAGVTIAYLKKRLGPGARVARVMPNTPALLGCGAAGFAMGPECAPADADAVRAIFDAVGIAIEVTEAQLDAVTAISGSGPAYFFYMVECLIRAGAAHGLPADVAERLAVQTLYGAGRLLAESGEPAGQLRERVTSPGGTTEAALAAFDEEGFSEVVQSAVAAAVEKAQHLAQ